MFFVVGSCDLDRDIGSFLSVIVTHCMLTYIRLYWRFRRFLVCSVDLSCQSTRSTVVYTVL